MLKVQHRGRLEAQYGLDAITASTEDGVAAGLIRPLPAEPLARLLLSAVDEAALMAANAPDPSVAVDQAERPLDTLLANPK